jgi:colanic acid biosynthesis glycosyl transferase WcaI
MGMGQGLDTALDAAVMLAQRAPNVRMVFIGGGVDRERLQQRALKGALNNVLFLPRVDPSEMGPILAATDAALVHLVDDPLFRITIPSKMQRYMLAGRPLLCGVRGDAATLVDQAGCGLAFPPQDASAMADAVMRLSGMPAAEREAMGLRGRAYYANNMSLSVGCMSFVKIFEAVCAAGQRVNGGKRLPDSDHPWGR